MREIVLGALAAAILAGGAWLALDRLRGDAAATRADPTAVRLSGPV